MTSRDVDADLQAWRQDWTTTAEPVEAPERLRRHVRRRSRLIRAWIAGDTVVGLAALAFVGWVAVTVPDPVDRTAMALLAAITVGALGFAWWNWFGTPRPVSETTATFLAVADDRCRSIARAVRAAWVILAAEAVVFVPFVAWNAGPPRANPGPWLFLTAMLTIGATGCLFLGRWSRREAAIVAELRKQIEGE
jgi:hypothetical protein